MTIDRAKKAALVFAMMLAMMANGQRAQANAPIKFILSSHIGWEVDKLTDANVCTILSKDECQQASKNGSAGGFDFPEGTAGVPPGSGLPNENDVYVADTGNARVQELTEAGEFVFMFGRKVNKNGGDFCTKAEENECQAGETGSTAGAFAGPQSIAISPVTGNLYILDHANYRIDEYDAQGHFILMIGREVNATRDAEAGASESEKNICTAISKDTCRAGVPSVRDSSEKGAFGFAASAGNLLGVGGAPEYLVYVGDEHRVQKFDETGEWKGEIRLPNAVTATAPDYQITALAVDGKGPVYLIYNKEPIVREYDPVSGDELGTNIGILPREVGQPVEVLTIGIDFAGHLAVWADEGEGGFIPRQQFGNLYEANDGHILSEFSTPGAVFSSTAYQGANGLGFNGEGKLYSALLGLQELWNYVPEAVAELLTSTPACSPGPASGTSDTFGCTLNGVANPYNVANTNVWFEWGLKTTGGCAPFAETSAELLPAGETLVHVSAQLDGLRPNGYFCYRLAGTDEHSEPPEKLVGNMVFAKSPSVAPKTIGQPAVSFVKTASVVLSGEVNPENADTEYFFEYGPGNKTLDEVCPKGRLNETCPGVSSTPILESEVYGPIGVTLEARNLQPGTLYHYRLVAKNEAGEVVGTEGNPFETTEPPATVIEFLPPPQPHEVPPTLTVPPDVIMLPSPPFSFPSEETPLVKCRRGYIRNSHKRCVKVKSKQKKTKKGRKR
jgi:hypothetical protein